MNTIRTILVWVLAWVFFSWSHAQAPQLDWAGSISGTGIINGTDLVMDDLGYVYTTGYFTETADFDPGPGVMQLSSHGEEDIFLQKLDADGNLIWAYCFGSTYANECGSALMVDADGNIFLTGKFSGTIDFNPGPGTYTLTSIGMMDVFLLKLTSEGLLAWVKQVGHDFGNPTSVSLEMVNEDIFLLGHFWGHIQVESYYIHSAGESDIFMASFNEFGQISGIGQAGGSEDDFLVDSGVSPEGNLILTGHFQGTADLDLTTEVAEYTSAGSTDIFILQLPTGDANPWIKTIGFSKDDYPTCLTVADDGSIYISGNFQDRVDFDPGPNVFELESAEGDFPGFILNLNGDGTFGWAQLAYENQSEGYGFMRSMGVDSEGNIYHAGIFQGTLDFATGTDELLMNSSGMYDGYIRKMNLSGQTLWAKKIGAAGDDKANAIFIDPEANIYAIGNFQNEVDFNWASEVFTLTAAGFRDAFVAKWNPSLSGTTEIRPQHSLMVYPNPTTGLCTLHLEADSNPVQVSIQHLNGQLLYSKPIAEQTTTIDLKLDGPPGIYLLIVDHADGYRSIQRIIKQ